MIVLLKKSFLKEFLFSLNFLSINKLLFLRLKFTLIPNLYIDNIKKPIELEKISLSNSIKIFMVHGTIN